MSQKDSQATNSTAAAPETLAESNLDQVQGNLTTRIDGLRRKGDDKDIEAIDSGKGVAQGGGDGGI